MKRSAATEKKEFRLIDFNVYDEKREDADASASSSSSDEETVTKFKGDTSKFVIQMFGINETGETCCLYLADYYPFFYVRVGLNWQQNNLNMLMFEIKNKIGKYYEKSIIEAEIVEHEKLYGFTNGKKCKFVKFTFKNSAVMNKVKNLWYVTDTEGNKRRRNLVSQSTHLELYESNIPAILRYFHIYKISPSGWISILLSKVQENKLKTTTCKYEYLCKPSHIIPLPTKETIVPYKICSFDIEASSSHGDFPLPKKTYKRLATNIADYFAKQYAATNAKPDKEFTKKIFEKCIYAAFGYSNCSAIDAIYAKIHPSKEMLSKMINRLVTVSVNDSSLREKSADVAELLTIDEMFNKINSDIADENAGDENVDCGDCGDCGDIDEIKPAKYSKTLNNKFSAKSPTGKSAEKYTIIDMILDAVTARDEKIVILNELLTTVLPRVEGDKVTFIGSTFIKYGEKEPYRNHCLVLNTCDDVEGVEIVPVKTEEELLVGWADLIQEENPDIIIGYNIFGFDYEFMFRRAEELNCVREFLRLSKNVGEICLNERTTPPTIETKQIVLATGEYNLKFPKITGRLQIDLYCYFRREFSNLQSFKLDDVAGQNISDDIKSAEFNSAENTTTLHTRNTTGLHKHDYIHIEIQSFTTDYYDNGRKYFITDIAANYIVVEGDLSIIAAATTTDKQYRWCIAKDDVTPQDIFKLSAGSSADRAKVAKYCIQDCNLVQHLMKKIDLLTGFIEMSSICSVPISFLIFRGQGIKLTSFVAKKCRESGILMPDLEKSADNDKFEGAIVLPPKSAMYIDVPVACVDYSSLYPSIMKSNNLSQNSKVWTKEFNLDGQLIKETGEKDSAGNYIYDNLPDFEYIDIEFDTFTYRREKPTAKAKKVKNGTKICRWAQFPDGKYAIMPNIITELLEARKSTKKKMKTETDPFIQNILDKRQLGYKVTANSLYGQCGAATSTFYDKDIAASTTATGRTMIIYAKTIIEEVYGKNGTGSEYVTEKHGLVNTNAEYIYGDSVANYTPVYLRIGGAVFDVCTIEEAAVKYGGDCWVASSHGCDGDSDQKEYCELSGVESWSETGWTNVSRIIRHRLAAHKKMVRVLTHTGLVDCTDDHSLLTPAGEPISPKDICVGNTLLHHTLDVNKEFAEIIDISSKEQRIYLSLSCRYEYIKEMQIHNDILKSNIKTREYYLNLLCHNYNAERRENGDIKLVLFNQKGRQLFVSSLILLANSLNYTTTLDTDKHLFIITLTQHATTTTADAIKKMHELPNYAGKYVYDLTTENHHFAAGVGNMIVHNTDSVFFTFNLQDPTTGELIKDKKALEITIEIAQDAAKLCSKWLKTPMELSYEKTLMPFILLSKKRYVGMLYEFSAELSKAKLKFMGLSIKRKDSCDYLKDIYGQILNILMKEKNLEKAVEFLKDSLEQLIVGNVPMEKLIITKALKSDYKNPQQIAHRVLADRIAKRDEGNAPKSGDRMRFIHFVPENTQSNLQGDKIETPEFIIENKLKIDYTFYITNQLMKPLQQLFALSIIDIWKLNNRKSHISKYNLEIEQMKKKYTNFEEFMKKKEKFSCDKVNELIFEPILKKIYNKNNNIQTMDRFLIKK